MGVVEFLLARIAEDEAAARGSITRSPSPDLDGIDTWEAILGGVVGPCYDKWKMVALPSDAHDTADHIARHDPARVLAECKAKRAIIEFHKSWPGARAARQGRVVAAVSVRA